KFLRVLVDFTYTYFCSASLDSVFSRFQVDLMHGSDIVLHFNPRYAGGSEYVVHNTCQYGHWGSEERKYETPFPRGQMFALQILTINCQCIKKKKKTGICMAAQCATCLPLMEITVKYNQLMFRMIK
uniref:Galectin n=1 Tax=Sinocyclocheilus grahami TaxID=75366 RepID=A0A672LJF7_SINGR